MKYIFILLTTLLAVSCSLDEPPTFEERIALVYQNQDDDNTIEFTSNMKTYTEGNTLWLEAEDPLVTFRLRSDTAPLRLPKTLKNVKVRFEISETHTLTLTVGSQIIEYSWLQGYQIAHFGSSMNRATEIHAECFSTTEMLACLGEYNGPCTTPAVLALNNMCDLGGAALGGPSPPEGFDGTTCEGEHEGVPYGISCGYGLACCWSTVVP